MTTIKSAIILAICLTFMSLSLNAAPQNSNDATVQKYSPYNYEYKVEDAEKKLYHDKSESGDDSGKVIGKYSVLLPDGRLMLVEYSVSRETGFVPKISFVSDANPFSG